MNKHTCVTSKLTHVLNVPSSACQFLREEPKSRSTIFLIVFIPLLLLIVTTVMIFIDIVIERMTFDERGEKKH